MARAMRMFLVLEWEIEPRGSIFNKKLGNADGKTKCNPQYQLGHQGGQGLCQQESVHGTGLQRRERTLFQRTTPAVQRQVLHPVLQSQYQGDYNHREEGAKGLSKAALCIAA